MKRLLSVLVAAVFVSCSLLPAFASTATPSDPSGTMEISAVRTESITVSYPADTKIPWNTQGAYSIGEISAPEMVIAADKKVVISVSSQNNSNFVDGENSLPYTLGGADSIEFTELHDASVFPLTVSVTQENWDAAPAGEYGDLLTFTLEYVNK